MAAVATRTGHGATLTLSGFSVSIISIGGFTQSRPALDTSHLGTTDYRTFIPGDLADPGEFEVTFFYDSSTEAPIVGAAASLTITLPDSTSGSGSGATIAASAFCTSWTTPELVTDQLMTATATFKWADGPTFTDET